MIDYGYVAPFTVHFDDLDPMGIVHNSRYAVFLERALSDWWAARGHSFTGGRPTTTDAMHAVAEYSISYYAPVRGKWFVISGTMGDQEFYERVSFTCGGQLINSWAMIYPKSERRFYNRVVEAVARTYSPGAGRTGQCD